MVVEELMHYFMPGCAVLEPIALVAQQRLG
jgi:hypothetical protein